MKARFIKHDLRHRWTHYRKYKKWDVLRCGACGALTRIPKLDELASITLEHYLPKMAEPLLRENPFFLLLNRREEERVRRELNA